MSDNYMESFFDKLEAEKNAMSGINYRQQWADGEIEAGTLLDAIDALAQRCRELETENEDLVFALSDAESRANNAGRNASAFEDRMGNLQVANGKLVDELADLKARMLEAERGAEELVRLRAERRDMERKAGRYDYIRSMWPPQFTVLFERRVETGESFDILVDAAMEAAACATTDGATPAA